VTLRDIVRFKAERPDATGQLVTEPSNSNGNDFRGGVTVGYILSDSWAIEGSAAVCWVDANGYAAGNPLRDGGRVKVAFGPAVTWSPTRTFSIAAGIAYFVLDTEPSRIFPTGGTFNGVGADIRLTFRF
jgi:long-subunit fatty acid transport protein